MHWLKRWIGKRAEPEAGWSYPSGLEVIQGALSITVFEHEVETRESAIPCWTFVTDGLLAHRHKELVVTVARSLREHPGAVSQEMAKLLATLHQFAVAGRSVDVGDITVFNGPGPLGSRGLAYISAALLAGVDVPVAALTVIPLMGAEAEVAHRFGVARVIARLALHYRYYPCPPWWLIDARPLGLLAHDAGSGAMGMHRVPRTGCRASGP